jgi:hypothetical protein
MANNQIQKLKIAMKRNWWIMNAFALNKAHVIAQGDVCKRWHRSGTGYLRVASDDQANKFS